MIFKTVCVHQIYALRLCVFSRVSRLLFFHFQDFIYTHGRPDHISSVKTCIHLFGSCLTFCCEFSHYPCNRYSSSILYSILFLNSVCILVLDTSISVLRQRLRSEVIELPLEYTAPISQRPYYRFPHLNSFQIISISQSILKLSQFLRKLSQFLCKLSQFLRKLSLQIISIISN